MKPYLGPLFSLHETDHELFIHAKGCFYYFALGHGTLMN